MSTLLETRLDVQVVFYDRVIYRGLHTNAKTGVLVQQGKPERAVSREIKFLVDCRADYLVNEVGGIHPVGIGSRAVVEDIARVNICPVGNDRARCAGHDIRDLELCNSLFIRRCHRTRVSPNENIHLVISDELGYRFLSAFTGGFVISLHEFNGYFCIVLFDKNPAICINLVGSKSR